MTLGLFGTLDGGKRSGDRGKIDLGERARGRQALAALWRTRAVEGADRRKGDAFKDGVTRGPNVALAGLQLREIGQNALALLPVGLALDPRADGIAVLARGELHGDEDVGLRKHILVHDGGALGDEPRNETAHAAAADDFLDVAEQAFPAFDRTLRRPQIGFVENEVERFLVAFVEGLGKRRHKAAARRCSRARRDRRRRRALRGR